MPDHNTEFNITTKMDLYYRGYALVDLDAVRENFIRLKSCVGDQTGLIAVVKADGYGHGAVPVARALSDLAYGFATATVFEAENLIRHGINRPVFLLGHTPEAAYDTAIKNDIRMVVYNYDMAGVISEHAEKLKKNAKIHLAVDTGMSRIGWIPSRRALNEILMISSLPGIEIEGVFTHFARADEKDKTSAKEQYKKFLSFTDMIEKNGVHIPLKHCANSAAIMEMPDTGLNLARAGIAMYGLYPSDEMDKSRIALTPALSLHSRVTDIRVIEKGTGVSYGHTFKADRKTAIATVPVGYGDGYSRNLSNRGSVLIGGRRAPVTGRVCMDQFMVDVTGMNVSIGDPVTLIGRDGDEEITVEELSVLSGSFHYEMLCNLGKRIPRVYVRNGKIISTKDYYYDPYD